VAIGLGVERGGLSVMFLPPLIYNIELLCQTFSTLSQIISSTFTKILITYTLLRNSSQIKGIQIGKETVKVSLFADMILYIKDLKNSTPKHLDPIKQLHQCGRTQNQLTKTISFSIHQQ
jgi:hypothetical protein